MKSQWSQLEGYDNIKTVGYSFGGGGLARSFAVRGPNGWVVISPPCKPTPELLADLESSGGVSALVAPNAYHYLGIAPWKERFSKAQLLAPVQSIPRLSKKMGRRDFMPLSEAADACGNVIELIDMPHYKTGEALVRVPSARGDVWHVTDVIFNWPKVPPIFVAKLLFTILSDSAPGLKLCGPAAWVMMKDKRAVYRWLKEEAIKAPPTTLVPSHGTILTLDPPGKQLVDLLTSQGKA